MPAIRARAACVLLAAAVAATALAADSITLSPEQITGLGIAIAEPRPGSSPLLAGLPARIVIPDRQQAVLSAPLAGLVESVVVAVPDQVGKGQVLITIQSPAVAEAQRSYLEAAAQARLAEQNLARDESLLRDGIIARSRYEATRAQHDAVASTLAERRVALALTGVPVPDGAPERAGALGGRLALRAPIDGIVLDRVAVPGQRVEAGAALMRIGRLDPLWVEMQVPAARARELEAGLEVTVPEAAAKGRISVLGRTVDPASQTVMVRAQVTEGASRLRPGEMISATIALPPVAGGRWTVPSAAIAREGDRVLVFARTAGGFRAVPVSLVEEGALTSIVAGPLSADTPVAVRGVAALKGAMLGIGSE